MSKFCPYRNGPALYTDCAECEDKICNSKIDVLAYIGKDGELIIMVPPSVRVRKTKIVKKHRLH